MRRIEYIGAVLQPFSAPALFSVVEPDGEDGQDGEGLDRQLEGAKHKLLALEAEPVDGHQHGKLQQPLPPEHMEHEHRAHAQNAVIREGQHARQPQEDKLPPLPLIPGPAGQQTKEEREHHVLVIPEARGARDHQIEGNLRNEGEDGQSFAVAPKIMGSAVALGDLEGEDGEGHAAHTVHPEVSRNHRGPHMVQKHQKKGQDAQVGGGEAEFCFVQWNPSFVYSIPQINRFVNISPCIPQVPGVQ